MVRAQFPPPGFVEETQFPIATDSGTVAPSMISVRHFDFNFVPA
jgi:hypothetical protein